MPKKVVVGPGVVLEIDKDKRRVLVQSKVVLRKGPLEGLLTRKSKKEHEYILAADIDARHVHTALELAKAKAGSPAKFTPKFEPATGSKIAITLRYAKGEKTVVVPASEWIKNSKTGKSIEADWVFAGSRFGVNPEGEDKPQYYMANHGDIITVVNMELALMDIVTRSPKALNQRIYEVDTAKIPDEGTAVEVILELKK
jgi:hypothetical protein